MAPPRKSLAQAALSGALYKNPQRYRALSEPKVSRLLGEPPTYLTAAEAAIWKSFADNMPWLNYSHRGITHIACYLEARMAAGLLGVSGMNLLRQCLGSMGGTPSSSRLAVQPVAAVNEDPADIYF